MGKVKKVAKKAIVKKTAPRITKKAVVKNAKKVSKKKAAVIKAKSQSKLKSKPSKSNPAMNGKAKKSAVSKSTTGLSKKQILEVFNPLSDRVVARVKVGEKKTAGGLYIPDTAEVSGNLEAQVLAVGKGFKNKKGQIRPMDVRKGDSVLFAEFSGTQVNIEGQDVVILRESEVLGIIEKGMKA